MTNTNQSQSGAAIQSPLQNASVSASDLARIYDKLDGIANNQTELRTSVEASLKRLEDAIMEHQDALFSTSRDNPGLQTRVVLIEERQKRFGRGIWLIWAVVGTISAGATIYHYAKKDGLVGGPVEVEAKAPAVETPAPATEHKPSPLHLGPLNR